MSDLFRSALGYLSNSVSSQGGGVGGGNNGGGGGGGGGVGGGGLYASASGGGSEEGSSSVGDVVAFTFQGKTRNVRINKLIAEGGFSYVYRGVEVQTGEVVAIKKMLSVDAASLKSVEEEVGYMGQFSHVNVVKFFGSVRRSPGGKRSEHFLAMEFCPVRLPTPPLRIQHTAQVFAQTCRAVKYLHDFGIVHRDIKLENLLIGVDGLLKLVDFGSCTMEKVYPSAEWSMSRRTIVEEEMAAKTTPMYRAPEMLDLWSNYPIDERVDLWALGCLLFALNFGQHPFHDSNKLAILNANYSLPKGVSDSGPIVSVVRGLLRVDPGERLGIGGVFEVLQSIAESQGFALGEPLPFKPIASPVVPGREGFVEGGGVSEQEGGGGIVNPLSGRIHVGGDQHTHGGGGGGSGSGYSSGGGGAVIGGSLLSSLKGGAASLLKNIKEQSQQYLAAQPVGGPQQQQQQVPSGGGGGASRGPPSRPPPPGQTRSANIEFENKEYEEHHQPKRPPPPRPAAVSATATAPPPSRPAPPKPPPPQKREPTEEIIPPTTSSAVIVDDLLDIETSTTLSSSVPAGGVLMSNADLLGDLFGGGGVASSSVAGSGVQEDDLFWGATQSSSSSNKNNTAGGDLLLGDSFASILNVGGVSAGGGRQPQQQQTTTFPFGSTSLPQQPLLQPSSSSFHNLSNQQQATTPIHPQTTSGLLDAGSVGGGGRGFMQNKNSSSPNLSDLILDDLMGTGSSTKQPSQQQQQPMSMSMNKSNPSLNKPNYNRSTIFDAGAGAANSSTAGAPGGGGVGGKQTLNDVFGDILTSQGFGGVGGVGGVGGGGPGGRTINEMRRIEAYSSPTADPVALKISEWREGKKKNIRALLASLHTVTWEGCSWEETNMSQMVSPAQVKKTYRKACLAVHPDKQMGMEWECLAKMIFVELNEAWAAFEDQQQQL